MASLQERFKLTERQAQAILDMRLRRLTGLERDKIEEEYNNLIAYIKELEEILLMKKSYYKSFVMNLLKYVRNSVMIVVLKYN